MTSAFEDGYTPLPKGKLATVVTWLEMTSPPSVAPPDWPEGITFQKVAPPAPAEYRMLFRAIGQNLLWVSRLKMSDETLAATLSHPEVELFHLLRDGVPIGLVELNFCAPGECELAFFGLVEGETGRGLGKPMMGAALAAAWARPVSKVWLHTCHFDHPSALAFYQRMGFRPVEIRVEVLDDPRLSGLLPREAAPQVPLID
ncbi:GCN5 family acetyltransferase [Haematobacter missouriensis]|uniref:GNAT family N-acetyltransferase n=1 Tax=Haematobacter missouriensis TaxID=366616 RepID=A0A212AMV3_9RHOB|nr:GNAT family N-acetyltransferase [Haematobacter missouriensis]KFI32380.1 GCN5 family acetyltransferase [Haematobacter missouriensis]OWJ71093.1 GNAT family N-acetyltransferase [Haematobacter missouriensis]OWJ82795.1 GNAT family N-acetyltransferase [Haematobacter missouriensis]